jgi:hypothetical protein
VHTCHVAMAVSRAFLRWRTHVESGDSSPHGERAAMRSLAITALCGEPGQGSGCLSAMLTCELAGQLWAIMEFPGLTGVSVTEFPSPSVR